MPRKPKRKKQTSPGPSRRRKYLVRAALVLLAAFAIYLGYLNHLINGRFVGDTWALPSRVFARAQELYPGLALTREQLVYELGLSSYLEVDSQPVPGQFRLLGASLELNTRAFDFSDQFQDSSLVQVFFERGRVTAMTDSRSGADLQLFRLPPVIIGSYSPDNDEDRLLLTEAEVPKRLIEALIA